MPQQKKTSNKQYFILDKRYLILSFAFVFVFSSILIAVLPVLFYFINKGERRRRKEIANNHCIKADRKITTLSLLLIVQWFAVLGLIDSPGVEDIRNLMLTGWLFLLFYAFITANRKASK